MAKQVSDATGPNQHIAPGVTDQVPPQPGMWMGAPAGTSGVDPYGPPENWGMGTPGSAAGPLVDVNDMIVPYGGVERLGAAYHIKTNIQYSEPANWQPTRASEFYGWTTGR